MTPFETSGNQFDIMMSLVRSSFKKEEIDLPPEEEYLAIKCKGQFNGFEIN